MYSQETSGLPLLQTRNGKDQACSKFTASDKSAVKTDLVNGSPSLSEKTPKLTNQSVNQCHDQLPRPAVAHVRALVTYLTQQLHSYEKVIQQSSEVHTCITRHALFVLSMIIIICGGRFLKKLSINSVQQSLPQTGCVFGVHTACKCADWYGNRVQTC